jgi:hypothetical protein
VKIPVPFRKFKVTMEDYGDNTIKVEIFDEWEDLNDNHCIEFIRQAIQDSINRNL